ncbi:hypothetical protein [Marisediminicola senii]|nr:hypothetical protein [Marisediminicola senii]
MGVAVAILFVGMVLLVLGVAAIPVVVAGFLILFSVLIAGVARLASIR